jgi:starch synthase
MSALRVLFVASECAPYRKTGGLGDVVGALPRFLRRRGLDVRVVVPLYAGFDWSSLDVLDGAVEVHTAAGARRAGVRMSPPGADPPVYFLEHHRFFDRPHLYGPPGEAYGDNLERFTFFSHAALALCEALGFRPHVVHAHDWQTALVPALVRHRRGGAPAHTTSAYSIHNLAFQGVFPLDAWPVLGLPDSAYSHFEHFGSLNLVKGALLDAAVLTTVSPTYAGEIRTPEHGMGLDGVLRGRGDDFVGILNGIDPEEWSPATDPHLAAPFDAGDASGKARCKGALQREAGLAVRPGVPIFAWIGRLTEQKGIDVLVDVLEEVLDLEVQFVLLGTGHARWEDRLRELARRRGERLRVWLDFDDGLAHRIEAGADFFVMPSRFEPCGLNQLYSLRYGALPIVHATGGLADTVESLDESRDDVGTGFVFEDFDARSLYNTLGWALATWYERPATIAAMRRRAMRLDFSWHRSAAEYEALYRRAVEHGRG